MGLYLRKSVRVGSLRFNFSKSGIGVSGGFKGFRVGTGPRGNYVHMGAHGIYYRKSLGAPAPRRALSPGGAPVAQPVPYVQPSQTDLTPIESGSVLEMVDSSAAELLEEIRAKRRKLRLWPLAFVLSAVALSIAINAQAPRWTWIAIALVGLGFTVFAAFRDEHRKSVVVFYDLEDESSFQALHTGFDWLAACARVWRLDAEGRTSDWKRSAGATGVVKRHALSVRKGAAPYIKTNVAVPTVPAGRKTLFFFPDHLLVFEGRDVGAVDYGSLDVQAQTSKFIEDEGVPPDATVLEYRWKFINKKGGPDRRFKNNRQLPVTLYGELRLRSATGLNEAFQMSRSDAPAQFATAIAQTVRCLTRKHLDKRPQIAPPMVTA